MLQQDALFDFRTVLDNCLLGLEINKNLTNETKNYVLNLLKIYGLKDFINSYPATLSGGMRQRVALIRTLATKPDILLLDEPFSALDMQTRHTLQEQLIGVWKRFDTTIVFVTHDVDEAVFLADKVVVMDKNPGRVKDIVSIDLERPRKRESTEFLKIQEEVMESLGVHDME